MRIEEFGLEQEVRFIKSSDYIFIPTKIHLSVDKLDKEKLKKINKNISVAKELCLYFISFLTIGKYSHRRYININAQLLAKKLRKNGYSSKTINSEIYTSIIDILDESGLIYVDRQYIVGVNSRSYTINDEFYDNGHFKYKIKTKYVKDIINRNYIEMLAKVNTNILAKNSLRFYTTLELPTKEELMERGKYLSKNNYMKRGKKLTMRYRKKLSYWKDIESRTFVEDAINKFDYFTDEGYIIPIVGGDHCPRVYDSMNLMNSWVRSEVKSNGSKLIECDIKCFHPNLIMNIYNGKMKNITHEKVAEELGLEVGEVKTLHLSFFNMEIKQMMSSKLWKYYEDNDKETLDKIIEDKRIYGHKHTSKLLFTLETEIMERTISRLNLEDIYVGYVFDAIYSTKKNISKVNRYLNESLEEMNINTISEIKK